MLDKNLYWIIREYAGTSLSKQTLADIKYHGKLVEASKFVEVGEYVFRVERECTCAHKCGGLFCTPLNIFNMVGLKAQLKCEIITC